MKKTLAKILCLALACVMAVGCFVSCGDDEEAYVIGASGPVTGVAAVYGEAVRNAAQMAIDEINANGGLNGVEFKLVFLDDKHDAGNISTNYASLVEQGMQVSLGTVTTAPGREFTKYSAQDNVFFLTPSATGDDIPGTAGNGFQMCFADGDQGKVAAEYVNGLFANKGKTIGILYNSADPYSSGIYTQFKAALDSTITTIDAAFTDDKLADFSGQISQLASCDFIFMPIYYTPASTFMKQAKDTIAPNATYYGCDGLDGIDGSIDGFNINDIPQEISMLSHFNSKATEGKAKEFIDKYVDKYGKDTLSQFGAAAYDCVYAIYGAMKNAIDSGKEIPTDITASALCDILKAEFNGGFTYSGVTGSDITWSANGKVQKDAVKYIVKAANAQ
ncbi:MAG: ABC transporter substrate-binding protein [Clostridia bacterium]|nr:ABC transporter substrate-binding protein [Clostridia bacterium]